MGYVASDKITVFPNAQRAAANTAYLKARKMTEENIVGILNHVNDQVSYVVSNSYSTSGEFEFVIGGYYFRLHDADLVGISEDSNWGAGHYIKATINTTTLNDYTELEGQDSDNTYGGINIGYGSGSIPQNTEESLVLLVYEAGESPNAVIPLSSRKRFSPDRIDVRQIAYIGGITVS